MSLWQKKHRMKPSILEEQIGKVILNSCIKVHKTLGPGLLEKVYEICLAYELKKAGFKVVLAPKAKIWHIRQASMSKIPKWLINWYILKNRLMLILKYKRLK